jgi:pimeloyl-ACP methyl ester carboxylesterase
MIEMVNSSKDFVDGSLIPAIKTENISILKDDVQSIRAPTLVLQGTNDEVVKFNVAEYYRDHIQNAKLVVIALPQLKFQRKDNGYLKHENVQKTPDNFL